MSKKITLIISTLISILKKSAKSIWIVLGRHILLHPVFEGSS